MRIKASPIKALALLLLAGQTAGAGEIVGYTHFSVPPQSDVVMTVPFTKELPGEEGDLTIDTETASGVTVAGSPFTANEYDNTHYVRIIDGAGEGLWSTITLTSTGGLDLEDPDILAHTTPGDTFRVYRHRTVGDVFPANLQGVSHGTGVQLLLFDNDRSAPVANPSAADILDYFDDFGWFDSGFAAAEDRILEPETRFVIRNNTASTTFEAFTLGDAADHDIALLLQDSPLAATADFVIGSGLPVPVTIGETGLGIGADGDGGRQVFFFDSGAGVQNPSASEIFEFFAGFGWIDSGFSPADNEEIRPGESITLRLEAGSPAGLLVTIPNPLP